MTGSASGGTVAVYPDMTLRSTLEPSSVSGSEQTHTPMIERRKSGFIPGQSVATAHLLQVRVLSRKLLGICGGPLQLASREALLLQPLVCHALEPGEVILQRPRVRVGRGLMPWVALMCLTQSQL